MAKATDESDRIDFLFGQVHALTSFLLAVVYTHPHPALLQQHLKAVEQVGLAKVEGCLYPTAPLRDFST
jgi:hypothetical protein